MHRPQFSIIITCGETRLKLLPKKSPWKRQAHAQLKLTQNKQILLVNIQNHICNCLRASQPECSEVFDINIYGYYPESQTPDSCIYQCLSQ